MIVVAFGFIEAPDLLAFGGKRYSVCDRVGIGEPIAQFSILFFWIKLVGDALARLLNPRSVEPFRHQFDDDVGQRADQRHHQDDEGPGLQAPRSGGVVNQRDIEQEDD